MWLAMSAYTGYNPFFFPEYILFGDETLSRYYFSVDKIYNQNKCVMHSIFLFVCVLVITHLRFQTYKWKNSTQVALAIYWFLKHTMIFHTSGP